MRTGQALADEKGQALNYTLLLEVLDMASDFGDIEWTCECQQRKLDSYYGRGGSDRANYINTLYGTLPDESNSW